MKFAADRMLGKLAKWLRILGYDTLYVRRLSDHEFLKLATPDRILLSRNTRLRNKISPDRFVFVEADDPSTQLQDLIRSLDLKPDPDRFFTRCTVCNGRLVSVKGADVAGQVPDHVWTDHERFSRCEDCGKIYWPGTHPTRSRKEIERLLGV